MVAKVWVRVLVGQLNLIIMENLLKEEIERLKLINKWIYENNLQNEQYVLNYLDELNAISVQF